MKVIIFVEGNSFFLNNNIHEKEDHKSVHPFCKIGTFAWGN